MMSRGAWPLTPRPRRRPAARPASAGDPGATATIRGADTAKDTGRTVVAWDRARATDVLLAAPRGFCAGVEMAIKALAWMVRAFEPPVYCYHEIVHNQLVVQRFEASASSSSTT